jgi:hypothetical protein
MERGGEEGVDLGLLMGEDTFGKPMPHDRVVDAAATEEEAVEAPDEAGVSGPEDSGPDLQPHEEPDGTAPSSEDEGTPPGFPAEASRDEAEASEGGRW